MTTASASPAQFSPIGPTKAAFEKHQAGINGVTLGNLREARVDVNALAVRLATVVDALREMRPRIVVELPTLDLDVYDSIEERLHAALYCNMLWQAKGDTKVRVHDFALVVRDWLSKARSAYEALIRFGLVSAETKSRLKRGRGYGALANNMGLILGVLRGVTPEVLSRTPLEPQDLQLIEHHLLAFQTALGQSEYAIVPRHEAGLLRAKAFTYLYEAYELARRAAFYLHGYERGDELVPSLFVTLGESNKRSRRKARSSTTTDASAATTSASEATLVELEASGANASQGADHAPSTQEQPASNGLATNRRPRKRKRATRRVPFVATKSVNLLGAQPFGAGAVGEPASAVPPE